MPDSLSQDFDFIACFEFLHRRTACPGRPFWPVKMINNYQVAPPIFFLRTIWSSGNRVDLMHIAEQKMIVAIYITSVRFVSDAFV